MKPVVVCVHGIDFGNRGALMMLQAIQHFVVRARPEALVCVPFTDGDSVSRRGHNVSAALMTRRLRVGFLPLPDIFASTLAQFLPVAWRRAWQWVLSSEIDLHLDASGYAYGDPWGPTKIRRMNKLAMRWGRLGKPLLVLPQAFGPFDDDAVRDASRAYLDRAVVVFARDSVSRNHLQALQLAEARIELAPDFTLINSQNAARHSPRTNRRAAIVPNKRFLDRGGASDAYIQLLVDNARLLEQHRFIPEIVLFDAGDAALARAIARTAGCALRIEDGGAVSAVAMGDYALAVCSRYHAIVAALHRDVPVIALGWTHKYHGLMADFGLADRCFTMQENTALRKQLINIIASLDEEGSRIRDGRLAVEGRIQAVWDEVYALLPPPPTPASRS